MGRRRIERAVGGWGGGGAGEGLVGVRERGVGMMVGGTEFVIWGIEGFEG